MIRYGLALVLTTIPFASVIYIYVMLIERSNKRKRNRR